MLKQTVTYTDFNDEVQTEDLYFNISKTELTENFDLKDRFEAMAKKFEGPKRELTVDEIREVLGLVKLLMKLSYGIRSADGKRFRKNNDIWEEFTETAAYDAFLFSLFDTPDKAVNFMLGVLPKDLREEAAKAVEEKKLDIPTPKEDEKTAQGWPHREPTREEIEAYLKSQQS